MEGDPQHAGGFVADLDVGVAQSCSDVSQARGGRLGTREVVGNVERCDLFVAGELVHGSEGDLLYVDIGTDI